MKVGESWTLMKKYVGLLFDPLQATNFEMGITDESNCFRYMPDSLVVGNNEGGRIDNLVKTV